MPRKPLIRSFPPVETARARVLILGSMPGRKSLEQNQYYAHPQNLFWRLMGDLLGAGAGLPGANQPGAGAGLPGANQPGAGAGLSYAARVRLLKANHIALWDVLESCTREGSLDSAIDDASIVPNDFASFYRSHPRIRRVFFNGAKAEASYRKYVLPVLAGSGHGPLAYLRLPSTSPAHAAMPYAQKRERWRAAVEALHGPAAGHTA